MDHLNYHHLRYFRDVAHEGNLTRAAERLNVSQSALSTQIRQLEERLGHALFERVGRRLELTEVGRIALDHADRIFATGQDLLATLRQAGVRTPPLRVGALSTLSRNFQIRFLRPVLDGSAEIVLKSGGEAELLEALKALALDVVLANAPPRLAAGGDIVAHKLDEQPVAIHGAPERLAHPTLRALLAAEAFIVPTEPGIRAGFAALADRLGVAPRIVADVDDMAMVRLLARDGAGLAVAPSVVLQDELDAGRLATAPFALDIAEPFYAITLKRRFPHPLLPGLLRAQTEPAQVQAERGMSKV
jgi:LysR family transcriptional activator of nhaA